MAFPVTDSCLTSFGLTAGTAGDTFVLANTNKCPIYNCSSFTQQALNPNTATYTWA